MLPPSALLRSLGGRSDRLRRVPARALALVLLLLQVTTGVVFPLMDAAEPHGTTVVAHVDGDSDRHCPPQHADSDCLVVKSLTASALPVAARPTEVGSRAYSDGLGPVSELLRLAAADRRIPPATGPPTA